MRRLVAIAATLCILLVVGAVIGRAEVAAVTPGAAALLTALGLPAAAPGLAFRLVTAEKAGTGSEATLVVEGEVANTSGDDKAVPVIELSVRDAGGRPFYTWTSEAPRRTLPPGETTRFRARLAAPPPEGTQVLVRFASARDGLVAGASAEPWMDGR